MAQGRKREGMANQVSICVIGSGYVGLVAAACFADMGHKVVCVDNDEARVKLLCEGGVPIFEEHLPELLAKHRGQGVTFTTNLGDAVGKSEAVFIAVGTPQGDSGAADLSYVEAVVAEIARMHQELHGDRGEEHGSGIHQRLDPARAASAWRGSRTLRRGFKSGVSARRDGGCRFSASRSHRGGREQRAIGGAAAADLRTADWQAAITPSQDAVPGACSAARPAQLVVTSTQSAEIIKHASNAFLAMKISFINAVANLAEAVDADIEDIAEGIGLDSRIGPKFLRAGLGYGGSCFPKDVAAFHWVAQERGVNFQLLEEVRKINDTQKRDFL